EPGRVGGAQCNVRCSRVHDELHSPAVDLRLGPEMPAVTAWQRDHARIAQLARRVCAWSNRHGGSGRRALAAAVGDTWNENGASERDCSENENPAHGLSHPFGELNHEVRLTKSCLICARGCSASFRSLSG